ncbi:venom protease-like [Daktulosphaira vitifoliae]|uniref:venom protease-like n=1 Tax=Daktulosphaira vitifoliae TaxID=58002 RepID=UPI0021A9A2E7|nr:venom protease-like [Daktulosphaira vitifoliae]
MFPINILFFLVYIIHIIEPNDYMNQKENELCQVLFQSNKNFTCERIDQCPIDRFVGVDNHMYPRICRFHGRTPVVCCPASNRETEDNTAIKKCKEYNSMMTNNSSWIKFKNCPAKYLKNKLSIVGGTSAKSSEFPHMVLLGFGERFENVEWSCGGSLISDRYILSAAHCSKQRFKGSVKWALMGDHDLATNQENEDPQIREIISLTVHPDYKAPSLYNDIGLYLLNSSVDFNKFIFPVCLNTKPDFAVDHATAIGWGRIDSAGPTSNILMKVALQIVKPSDCNQSYSNIIGNKLLFGINSDSQICAGEKKGGKDTCQGDSGGPLLISHSEFDCMYSQVGITSFGKLCGEPNVPGVYTKISKYINWIEKVVWPTQ